MERDYAEFARQLYLLGRVSDVHATLDVHSICDNVILKLFSHTGDVSIVRKLLQNGLIDPTSDHHAAIYTACIQGHLDVVKVLYPYSKSISIESACQYGRLEVVQYLIEQGVDPTFPYHYPFVRACERGYRDIVELLLTCANVSPNAYNNEALLRACKNGHIEIVRILLRLELKGLENRRDEILQMTREAQFDTGVRLSLLELLEQNPRFVID
jgi:ankyrin repeat protein